MKVTIVQDLVELSRIETRQDVPRVKDLPEGLRDKCLKLFSELSEENVRSIIVEDSLKEAILEIGDTNNSLAVLGGELREEFQETINLLKWFLGSHFFSHQDVIGAPTYCIECGVEQPPGAIRGNKCVNPKCPSHAKWKKVDPKYEAPKRDIRQWI